MELVCEDDRDPRIVRARGVLSPQRCRELIAQADEIGWVMDGKMNKNRTGERDYGYHPDARLVKEIWPHLTPEVAYLTEEFAPIYKEIGDLYREQVAAIVDNLSPEPLRLCRYPEGGFFSGHQDVWTSDGHPWRQLGIVIYLNNCVGGTTYFHDSNVAVFAEEGTAAVFPISAGDGYVHQSFPNETPKYMVLSWLSSPVPAEADKAPLVRRG